MTDFGSFQLTSVAKLANVTVAYNGEHWSDGKANAAGGAAIIPGTLVVPTAPLAGKRAWAVAGSGAVDPRSAIALRPVSVPDQNPGSEYNPQLTPNDIMNLPLATGSFVHAYRAGAFHLTLIVADSSYTPGDLIGWDPAATPQGGKPGPGAWKKVSVIANAFAEVVDWRPLTADTTLGVLTVHTLRVQS